MYPCRVTGCEQKFSNSPAINRHCRRYHKEEWDSLVQAEHISHRTQQRMEIKRVVNQFDAMFTEYMASHEHTPELAELMRTEEAEQQLFLEYQEEMPLIRSAPTQQFWEGLCNMTPAEATKRWGNEQEATDRLLQKKRKVELGIQRFNGEFVPEDERGEKHSRLGRGR